MFQCGDKAKVIDTTPGAAFPDGFPLEMGEIVEVESVTFDSLVVRTSSRLWKFKAERFEKV